MPISPRNLPQTDYNLDEKVRQLEAQIDAKLSERKLEPGVLRLFDLPPSYDSQQLIEIVIADYRAQGWEVTYHEGSATNPESALGFKYQL